MSSIFISHSSQDNAWAARIAAWLEGSEHKQEPERRYEALFLDFDPECGIPSGTSWRAVLYRKLRLCRAVIVVCSRRYCTSQWCLAELGVALHEGKLVLPLRFEPQADHSDLPRLLVETQSSVLPLIDLASADSTGWRALERGLEVLSWRERMPWPPPGQVRASPFPGLLAFDRPQAPVFFGRDVAIARVAQQLNALAQRTPALLVLLGASGTGKSSLVRAGVLPQLAADGDRRWRLLPPFRPGRKPLARVGAVEQQLEDESETPLLLVIDQFEELLLEGKGGRATEAEQFLTWLQSLLQQELSPLVVLATLRTDFLDGLQRRCPALAALAVCSTVEPIQQEDFAELICGPADRVGVTLQPGLQQRLVADSGGADALPLLAFTLEQLWLKRQARGVAVAGPNGALFDLTLADYETLDGVAGAVSHQAALCWDPLTSPVENTKALREAFVYHLVKLNDEGLAVKQPARWEELPEGSRPLLKRFVEARLLVSGGGQSRDLVEIAHEALLRSWEPLVQWIEDYRQALEQRRRVTRLCADLALNQPLQVRLAALQGLLALAEADSQAAAPAAEALAAVLTEAERSTKEWLWAIQVLGWLAGEASVAALSAFLEQKQLSVLMETGKAAPVLQALCQAAAVLQDIHRCTPPADDNKERWLLLPNATVNEDGRSVRTDLVRLRLWATPGLRGPGAWFEHLGEGVAITMVMIPAGSFLMGSSPDEESHEDSEHPQHHVSLEGFSIGQAPITQAQWRSVMNSNPSQFQQRNSSADNRPVELVSWNKALEFCLLLREKTGRYYTLPSEAQWEYACRAGTSTPFHHGKTIISELANYNAGFAYGNGPEGDYRAQTTPVDMAPANSFGLQDMHGNVREWCMDEWHGNFISAPYDGNPWLSPKTEDPRLERVVKGGSWSSHPRFCRSALRHKVQNGYAYDSIGFRVACLLSSSS